jgi:hypothetical protein
VSNVKYMALIYVCTQKFNGCTFNSESVKYTLFSVNTSPTELAFAVIPIQLLKYSNMKLDCGVHIALLDKHLQCKTLDLE